MIRVDYPEGGNEAVVMVMTQDRGTQIIKA